MIAINVAFSILASCFAIEPHDLPPIEYSRNPLYVSEGYKLGYVLDFYRYGIFPWSYEGTMMIGFGTGRQRFVDNHCAQNHIATAEGISDPVQKQRVLDEANKDCYVFSNPWPFSTLTESRYRNYERIDNVATTPVLLYYIVPWISVERLITRTRHFVEGIYPVNPGANLPPSFKLDDSGFPTAGWINIKRGFVDGRIVSASLDHWLRKSFEVTIQAGELGNNFRRMSVSSQEMFNYILATMLTGRMARIGYIELLGFENAILQVGKDYDTPYRIVSVELK